MTDRLQIILETVKNLVAGKNAPRLAAEARGRKGKGKLPSKGEMERLKAKAAQQKEIEELEKAD